MNATVIDTSLGKRILFYAAGDETRLEITDYAAQSSRGGDVPRVFLWGDDVMALAKLLAREVLGS